MKKIVTISVAACLTVMLFAGCGNDAASSASAASAAAVSAAAVETETTETAAPEVADEALDQAVLGTWMLSEVEVDGDPRMTLEEYAEAQSIAEESEKYKGFTLSRFVFAADGVFYDVEYEDYLSDYRVYDGYTWEIRGDTIYVMPKSDGQSTEEDPYFTATLNQGELKATNDSITVWMVKESDSQTPPESLE